MQVSSSKVEQGTHNALVVGSNPTLPTNHNKEKGNYQLNYVCYVFVRHLPHTLNLGKLAAQVHHAGTMLMYNYADDPEVKEWIKQGYGFGTTIVLEPINPLNSKEQIENITLSHDEFLGGTIVDPTYPVDFELTCECLTCGYILLDKDSEDVKIKELLNEIQTNWRLYK